MGPSYKILPHYSYDDYRNWEGAWELIDGIPYAMSPLPSVMHQHLSGNLYMLFRTALAESNCGCQAFLPIDYKVSENTVLQPDVLIVCENVLEEKFISKPPQLVAEILSPSTAMKDLNVKFQIYQSQKIPYYLIVDPDKGTIEVYFYEGSGYIRQHVETGKGFRFDFTGKCSVTVDFDAIWG